MSQPFRLTALVAVASFAFPVTAEIGQERAIPYHLTDTKSVPLPELLAHGQRLFEANWTVQDGAGRPLTKGTGAPLADPSKPLVFPRNFNRISAPDANSCKGCHNLPRSGGGGDHVANVFVLGQRFDFASFDGTDLLPTGGSVDESGEPVSLQSIANERNTLGMFGSGYIEMLARQMSGDLASLRDTLGPGEAVALISKGVDFGILSRTSDGNWNTEAVEGLPAPSLRSAGPGQPPNLLLRPFHQAGAVVSLREFTNNAFNHHHGMQSAERFGESGDADGDGHINELTAADITSAVLFQAVLPAPGRVIPGDPEIEAAIWNGEQKFAAIGCGNCHTPSLPLTGQGRVFSEPGPFNPPGNAGPGDVSRVEVDLSSHKLPLPRLKVSKTGQVMVPAYTDLKLHDITAPDQTTDLEPLDMLHPAGSPEFFAGNRRFLTRKLWGVASEPPYFHHGRFTTLREAIEAHHGEAEPVHIAWSELTDYDRDSIIEFLKSLRILPEDTPHLVIDEMGHPRKWPPAAGK